MGSIDRLLTWYFSKKSLPYWCILLLDCAIVFFSGAVVYWLFYRTQVFFDNRFELINTLLLFSLFSLIGFRVFSTYSGIMRYSSFIDLLRVAYGNVLSMTLVLVFEWVMCLLPTKWFAYFSTKEIVLTFFIATVLMWCMRVLAKTVYDVSLSDKRSMRVLVYGVRDGGVALAKSIAGQHSGRFVLGGFITHEKGYDRHLLMGKRVYSDSDDLAAVIRRRNIEAVLVSPLRNNEFRDNQQLQDTLISAGVKIFMIASATEVKHRSDGNIEKLDFGSLQLQEVEVEDLLPRDEISVDMDSIANMLRGQRILVTGSAGSIGSEMVKQIAQFKPSAMMLIDQAETPQHDLRLFMRNNFPSIEAETVVTSICKQHRMEHIFSEFRPAYVFHVAAYKHVPMMEDNPSEAVQNNVFGTKVLADLSVKYGVKKFVMVSTDKAVNPTNVMGCSKRICEIYVQSLNEDLKRRGVANATQFVTTRFGNVLGSNGSVIPIFREQIRQGGPVTVTHPDIIRYFMLISEACRLVLEAGTKGCGCEIFVFDMGKPVRIADLAARMIKLSGAINVKVEFTGLRPGEKLYEEVLNEQEGTKPSFHEKIRIADVRQYDFADVQRSIDQLISVANNYDDMATVAQMKRIVPEYKSNNSVFEQLDAK